MRYTGEEIDINKKHIDIIDGYTGLGYTISQPGILAGIMCKG